MIERTPDRKDVLSSDMSADHGVPEERARV